MSQHFLHTKGLVEDIVVSLSQSVRNLQNFVDAIGTMGQDARAALVGQ